MAVVRAPATVTIGLHENPGESVDMARIEMPLCLGASGLVRTASQT